MQVNTVQNLPISNKILALLPAKEYQLLLHRLEPVSLKSGEILYQPDDFIANVFFPTSAVVSLLSSHEGQTQMSVAMIGNDGMVGLPAFFGMSVLGKQAMVSGAGSAMKMKTIDFLDSCESSGVLQGVLQRYTHLSITKLSQLFVCSRFHRIESQLVCWLLMTHDRIETSDALLIKQANVAKLLGVRREAVTQAAGKLQKQQLISYNRGHLTILNRAALEAIACHCYGIIRAEEQQFLG